MELRIGAIAVRDTAKHQDRLADPSLLTTDTAAVVADPEVDIVVELIGGTDPALTLVRTALENGKPVITGNKELLAAHGPELYAVAAEHGVDLLFEAAVAGGIPLIRPLRESLVGEDISRVMGIINGTTNYILTKMSQEGADYADASPMRRRSGTPRPTRPPTSRATTPAPRLRSSRSIVFGVDVRSSDVQHEGISSITAADIDTAKRLGYVIKALAVIERADGEVAVRVHPAMVPTGHPLAQRQRLVQRRVRRRRHGRRSHVLRARCRGGPTASAVLGDLVDAAVNVANGAAARLSITEKATLRSVDELSSQYYLTMVVSDEPGVLAQVATVFGTHGVSIQVMEQSGTGGDAELCLILHETTEAALHATLDELDGLNVVRGIGSVIRLVSDD